MKLRRVWTILFVLILLVSAFSMHVYAQESVIINETTFPDANFRNYILSQDYGADGVLTSEELSQVTFIDVSFEGIRDLSGIEYFTAVEKLNCSWNSLSALDVSKLTALTYLDCHCNYLTSLDVSKNTALTKLYCTDNGLSKLDVSKNTELTVLDCAGNRLTELDVSKNTILTVLDCGNNQLTELDVSDHPALEEISCEHNDLHTLDVSGCAALKKLACYFNFWMTTLDVSGCTALVNLDCANTRLTALDVSDSVALEELDCKGNQLTSLNVSGCNALKRLSCWGNQLTTFDMGGCTALVNLNCSYNQLTSIDLSESAQLEYVDCRNNQLTSLNVNACTVLRILDCRNNHLTALDVSNNTALEHLASYSNQLRELDVSKNTKLTYLSCGSNQLTALDVSNNTALRTLYCGSNQLTALDVSKNTALRILSCSFNQLTTLDVSKNKALYDLGCAFNQLTTLDVSGCTALKDLSCSSNQLAALDVSKNTKLTNLFCSSNQLTTLNVSKNTALFYLYCDSNQLTSLDLSKNTKLRDYLRCEDNVRTVTATQNQFDLSTLSGFDVNKASDWIGGSVSGNILTVTSDVVTYTYNMNDRLKETFALAIEGGLSITTQPISATRKVGETATFTVVAVGDGLTYQWQYMSPKVGTWEESGLTGSKTAAIQVGAIMHRNNFRYRCKITDSKGHAIYSNAATLVVKPGPAITIHPTSTYLKVGNTANFKVVATGTDLTYQWQYKDPSVGTWYNSGMTGNKTDALQVGAITHRHGFLYRCKIIDGSGNVVYSNAATLTVLGIKTQPKSVTAKLNETAKFTVAATGTGLTYQWQYKNPSVGTWYNSGMAGNKTSVMTVEAIAFRNNFQYRCKITDSKGNVIYTNAVTLTVKSGPSITNQPTSVTAKLNEKVNFKVVATGTGLTYQWQYKNPSVGTWYNSGMTGNKTSVMTVEAIAFRNNFQYRCKITDSKGNVIYTNAVTLTVKSGPSITTHPTSTYLKTGSTANFKVVATGTGLTYQWQYKDPAVGTWYSSTLTGNKTSTIQVGATVGRNNFQYRCKITDGNGNVVYSNAATLTVFGIKTQPASATAKLNENVNFKVSAVGNGLTYQWQYMNPSVGKWYNSEMTGSKTSTMKVEAIAFRNNFQYRCKITDSKGNVIYTNAVKLTVK